MSSDRRPNPDELLKAISAEESAAKVARLRIFLGMSAGVGKTYAMLKAAHQRQLEGHNIVVGIVETHGRVETAQLLEGLTVVPRKKIEYKGTVLEELDLDAVLALKPEIVIVDELAHSNIPGSRHAKRYQDVIELLDAGIDVLTALNIQHLESRKDSVEAITQIQIRETVPDSILERASQVELVDIAPIELLKRLKEGKVYLGDKAERAAQNFFKEDRLTALREIALRLTAERVDQDLQKFANPDQNRGPWQTNERLLVAVSHSPYSEKLIRATRRLAYNLEAPWIALHIDVGNRLSDEDQAQLTKNLNLARELKAEVITTTELDVSTALRRIARQKNVTQILVGRPSRRWIRDLFQGGSLLDRLVRDNHEIDVHVIRQEGAKKTRRVIFAQLGRLKFYSGPLAYWKTLILIGLVTALSAVMNPLIGYRTVGFVFLLAVVAVGMIGSLGPVVFSALLSVFAWNFFFIPPRYTIVIGQPEDLVLCLAFIVVALTMGFLTTRIRFHERIIREREERTNVLYEILKDIANSREKSEFLSKIIHRTGDILDAKCAIFLADVGGKLNFSTDDPYVMLLGEKDQAVATWAFQSQKLTGWSTDSLADAHALYLPMKGLTERIGVFVFLPNTRRRLNVEQENLLFSIVRQVSISLERHFFEKRLVEANRLEASEKLHQTLLNSISHEMRTPLTTIIGTASALGETSNAGDAKFVKTAAGELSEAGDRLNRVIENLLDMSRLNSGLLELKLEWHDVSDLIGVTLKKLGSNVNRHKIKTLLPDPLPMIKMDFRLMEHALSNLILNAATYSPVNSEITISADQSQKIYRIIVDDEGPGVAVPDRAKIFDKFYRLPGTPTGGIGLGLSIVKSICEAHGGDVFVETNEKAGARFVLQLNANENAPSVAEVFRE